MISIPILQEKTKTKLLINLPKVTLLSERAGTQTQASCSNPGCLFKLGLTMIFFQLSRVEKRS